MRIAIIGGGAAGFMAAITAKLHNGKNEVVLFEKSNKVLAKVKISGGGRCNVTNACFSVSQLIKNYPRGEKFLKNAFHHFYTQDTIDWFESRGVPLKAEADNRMFPISDNSQSIVDCLMNEIDKLGVELKLQSVISKIEKVEDQFLLEINHQKNYFDKVIIATGGSPKLSGFDWINNLQKNIVEPVPSLFTFNIPKDGITELMGVVASNATVRIQGTKIKHSGPLLITHWGMSGPAVLKTSSFGARYLFDNNYNFNIQINWTDFSEEEYQNLIAQNKTSNRLITNKNPFEIPSRLWNFIVQKSQISELKKWNELSKKDINKLLNHLMNDVYAVKGKTTFKEEFVTSGGVDLNDINSQTMESKNCKGLYFCGEVMNIDGVTGGFNFQAAWTSGFLAGKNSTI
jgi:predicted Rossmann fold flavoprotein